MDAARSWALWILGGVVVLSGALGADPALRLEEKVLVIPQVDYEGAIYYEQGDPLPHIDLKAVGWDRIVDREHRAVVMENEYVRLTVLPEMGRVYALHYKPTGHEVLWRNDAARPGGGNNETGWWLWIGGIEYTLPKDEHGTTWALSWTYEILEDSERRKALRMQVEEPTSGLRERIDLSLYPGNAAFETDIRVWNPTPDTAYFAHWINPMWAPGGRNELTDGTEFIIPTRSIRIEERWQKNLGPSPQVWPGNALRFIRNWRAMGDIQADGLEGGFFGAYAHEEEEGVVRVFDPLDTPGVDVWTYGFHPGDIPMGSGAPNKGYVEMWGGTVEHFPDEVRPLAPGASKAWSEWMFPFQQTGGLSFANESAAVLCRLQAGRVRLAVCPVRVLRGEVELRVGGKPVLRQALEASPERPWQAEVEVGEGVPASEVVLRVEEGGAEVLRCRAEAR